MTKAQHYFAGSLFVAVLISVMPTQTRANVDVDLTLWHGYTFYYGDVSLTTTNPAPITYHRVESPNALIWQNSGSDNSSSSASLSLTNDLSVLVDEVTNGLWSLTLNVGDASEQNYAFSVDLANVTTGLFGNALITTPTYGSTVTTNQPLLEWTGPAQLPTLNLQISSDGFPYTLHDSAILPSTTTNWTPTVPIPGGNQSIFINYRSNLYTGATFSIPTNLVGGATVSGWSDATTISTYHYSTFTVPGTGSALGEAVDAPAFNWTTGGDGDWFDQTFETSDGTDAAQSGPIGDFESSWIETTIEGPGILSFSWGTFADSGDILEVELNGYSEDQIDGDWGWDYTDIFLDPGPNTIRWTFYNDDPTAGDQDAAFLDEVSFELELYHEAELDMDIQRVTQGGTTHYLIFPSLLYSNPFASVESPNGLCSGDDSSSSSVQFATLQDAINEIEAGSWFITFDNGSFDTEYYFDIAVNSLTTNDLPPALILEPLHGATSVATNSGYHWIGPPTFDELIVSARDISPSVSLGFASLPTAATSWTNGPALPLGTNSFSAAYTKNNVLGLTIDEPINFDTGDPLAYWDASVTLTTRGFSVFEVGGFAPVVLLPPTLSGGNFGLSFVSQPGAIHYVQYSTNLVTGPWMPSTNFPGNGTTNQITMPTTNSAAYYRIQTE